ncbi:NXPE family member 3-like [Etheostoma cragini]|uniref:NXPE family member 3-like n=1 Tax=Etheostoma cragini TaxID=417921 RepID=UPI00155E8B15|nr:NXPE family member 3-like [Etheostoma cragini]
MRRTSSPLADDEARPSGRRLSWFTPPPRARIRRDSGVTVPSIAPEARTDRIGGHQVTLVHPYEAIQVLKRLNSEEPDRISFLSVFRSGSISETTICNVCLRPTQPLCNYTDLRTGEPWFCYKPKNLSCDARINHAMGHYNQILKATEEKLFQSGVNLKVYIRASGPASVTVLPKKPGQPEVESSIAKVGPSGYYYQGVWHVFGIWAHFGTFPMEIYIRRLLNIRRAVVRLLDRAPDTLVVIRTGNPKVMPLWSSLVVSDWHALQCNKVLRTMFEGLNVHLIDAWEMVIAHHLPHNLHPPRPIIENMVNVILSYTCPQSSG